jgi:hypothetical protein
MRAVVSMVAPEAKGLACRVRFICPHERHAIALLMAAEYNLFGRNDGLDFQSIQSRFRLHYAQANASHIPEWRKTGLEKRVLSNRRRHQP